MKKIIRSIYDLLLGISFILSVSIGYLTNVISIYYLSEYCFISGMIVGIFFIISFFYRLFKKKSLPAFLYFDSMISIIVIFFATIAMGLNLEGAFWFIHIINPILLFFYWCIFCNHSSNCSNKIIFTVIAFPLMYCIYTFILWKTMEIRPFPVNLIFQNSILDTFISIIFILLLFNIIGCIFHFLNKILYKKFLK